MPFHWLLIKKYVYFFDIPIFCWISIQIRVFFHIPIFC